MALLEYNRSLDQGRLVRDANLEVLEVFYPPHFEDIDDAGVGNSSPIKKGAICTVIHEGKTNIAVYQGDGEWLIVGDSTLKLGETADTAHRGDHGKAAYEHSLEEGNPHNTQIADIDGLQTELDAKVVVGGDLSGDPNDVLIAKIRNAALAGQTTLVAVLPDGEVAAQETMEFELIDDTVLGYSSLSEIVAAYPSSLGYDRGFQLICPRMTPITVYKKISEGDTEWLRMTASAYTLMT